MISVLCVDDHPVVRDGIALMLDGHPGLRLVATASSGHEAIARFQEFKPDLTLMDLRLLDRHGSDFIAEIRTRSTHACIVALTTYPGDVQAARALKAGAMGFLLKSTLRLDLIDTIQAVQSGQRRICPEVAACMSEHITPDSLTEREIEVLRGVSTGTGNRGIAAQLGLSEETVRGHLKIVFQKLRANDRTHAVVIAAKRGFLTI